MADQKKPSPQLAARRRLIRVACTALGIDDAQRKAIMRDVAGVSSSTELSLAQADQVLDHLKRAGWTNKPKRQAGKPGAEWRFVFALPADRRLYGQKIYRLAERAGKLQSPPVAVMPKAWVEGIAERMRGCTQPLEFCGADDLLKIVQALEIHVKRNGT